MSDLSHDTHVLDLLPAYAIGSLEADELTRVEEHLPAAGSAGTS